MPKTVMIVEDNELNMKLFNDLLESRGYSIIQTRNGMEAIGLARAHHPDLILMDIQLPEVSGLVVTKWLKEDDELQSIPVIAVTASTGAYNIHCRWGALDDLGKLMRDAGLSGSAFVLSDDQVAPRFGDRAIFTNAPI